MNEFDSSARDWDNNPGHRERSEAVAKNILETIPLKPEMKGLEYGAGTGILSFLLSKHFAEITLMDNSVEMVKVMHEKVLATGIKTLKPLFYNLEESDYVGQKFDCIFTQMVLHHVVDTDTLLKRFYNLLNFGGFLAVADLYPEDGSFHGEKFNGHYGFDPESLQKVLEDIGFINIASKPCYVRKKEVNLIMREFPMFLLVAWKPNVE